MYLTWDQIWAQIEPFHSKPKQRVVRFTIPADSKNEDIKATVGDIFKSCDIQGDGVLFRDEFKKFIGILRNALKEFELVKLQEDYEVLYE